MASKQSTVDYIVEQMGGAGEVYAKKMFGDYGVFCQEKMVAIIGDNELYVKPTAGGREMLRECVERSPYPGAKPCFFISGEQWEDGEWLSRLIKITAGELPLPKEKKNKAKK
jgi:TfoX/Sxy family transcriptional regulator of competence genes